MSLNSEKIITETQLWIENMVIHHNFCPFAAKPFFANRIRYSVSKAKNEKSLVDDLIDEMLLLSQAETHSFQTSFLIVPHCLEDFDSYNQFITVVDNILEELNLEGFLQVATFHPDYCFSDLSKDDVQNYTNRSIYPMFHFIREDSVEAARIHYPDIDAIPAQNMDKLLSIGKEEISRQLSQCTYNNVIRKDNSLNNKKK